MDHCFEASLKGAELHLKITVARFNSAVAGPFCEDLKKIWQTEINTVVIDCSDVMYVDSRGIGVFLGVFRLLKNSDGQVFLKELRPEVKAVISLLRLTKVFHIS